MKTLFVLALCAISSVAFAKSQAAPEAKALVEALEGKTMTCADAKVKKDLFTIRADASRGDGFEVKGANDFPADSVFDIHAGDDQLMVKLALDSDEQSYVLYIDNPKGNFSWPNGCNQGALLKIDGEPDVGSSALSLQTVNCCLK